MGTVDPRAARSHALDMREAIGNSFAVDETGGVYIVTDGALYRFDAGADGHAARDCGAQPYDNTGADQARPDPGTARAPRRR